MSRVLVLEPDGDVRELFARLLRHLEHEPVFDPEAAGDLDVVLLEPASPAARGALAAVRKRRPDVYVVCASIYPREDAASVASDAFISKPVSIAALAGSLPDGAPRDGSPPH